jgi:hypothetical protein
MSTGPKSSDPTLLRAGILADSEPALTTGGFSPIRLREREREREREGEKEERGGE